MDKETTIESASSTNLAKILLSLWDWSDRDMEQLLDDNQLNYQSLSEYERLRLKTVNQLSIDVTA